MRKIFKSNSNEIKKVIAIQGSFNAIRIGARDVSGFGGIRTAEDHLVVMPAEEYEGGIIISYYTLNEWGNGGNWGFDASYLIKDGVIYELRDTIYKDEEIDWEDGTPINPDKMDHEDDPRDWGSRWHAMGVYLEIF
jgi:hypothetical protein